VDLVDLGTAPWSDNPDLFATPQLIQGNDGSINTEQIASQSGNSAAALCLNSTNGGQNDWYLPTIRELSILNDNLYIVNQTLGNTVNATTIPASYNTDPLNFLAAYWSSNYDVNGDPAARGWYYYFINAGFADLTNGNGIAALLNVRAIRKF